VILDQEQLIASYPFLARRYQRVAICDATAVRECCERAAQLAAGDPAHEPAAVFYAFADRRRAFPFAWKLMANVVARSQAHANGLQLRAVSTELDALCIEVLYRRMTWEAVREWFARRLGPLEAA
jgi:hypothetical protein